MNPKSQTAKQKVFIELQSILELNNMYHRLVKVHKTVYTLEVPLPKIE